MRLFLMALPFWLWGLSYGAAVAPHQEEGVPVDPPVKQEKATLLTYVVVYNYPGWGPNDPLINLRVVVRARDETHAVHVATGHIYKVFQTQFDRLEFVEAAQKKE